MGMLPIIASNGDSLFRNVNIDDLEWPWTRKIEGVQWIFRDCGLRHAFQ